MSAYLRKWLVLNASLTLLSAASTDAAETAANKPVEPERTITVLLYNYAEVAEPELTEAKAETARIFREAGVAFNWMDHPPLDADIPEGFSQAWHQTPHSLRLVLKIFPRAMAERVSVDLHELGFALTATKGDVFSQTAYVFYHRVLELAALHGGRGKVTREDKLAQRAAPRAVIFGHLMAHEIGHLLLGRGSHSPKGIMSTPWGPLSIARAVSGGLLFTPTEAIRIRAQVEHRARAAQLTR